VVCMFKEGIYVMVMCERDTHRSQKIHMC